MKLNETILHYRKTAGLSQEALAEKVGVSRQAVSKWERSDAVPDVDKLMALAQIFGVTTDELLGLEGPDRGPENRPPIPEDLDYILRRSARFRRWYLPIFIGLIFLVLAVFQVFMLQDIPDLPFIQKTMLPLKVMWAVLAFEGVGMIVWGVVRLIRRRREEKK